MYVVYVQNRSCECMLYMLKIGVVNICCSKCSESLDSSQYRPLSWQNFGM